LGRLCICYRQCHSSCARETRGSLARAASTTQNCLFDPLSCPDSLPEISPSSNDGVSTHSRAAFTSAGYKRPELLRPPALQVPGPLVQTYLIGKFTCSFYRSFYPHWPASGSIIVAGGGRVFIPPPYSYQISFDESGYWSKEGKRSGTYQLQNDIVALRLEGLPSQNKVETASTASGDFGRFRMRRDKSKVILENLSEREDSCRKYPF
jgi:hypothetical protein